MLALAGGARPALAGDALIGDPQTITSLNLCTDQLALALLPKARIASLSPLVDDAALSPLKHLASGLRRNDGRSERLLLDRPGLVMTGPWDLGLKRDLFTRHAIPVLVAGPWDDLATGMRDLHRVASVLDAAPAGEALIRDIEAALQAARTTRNTLSARTRRIAVLATRGYMPPPRGTLQGALSVLGVTTISADMVGFAGGVIPLERILADKPDALLVFADPNAHADGLGQAVLRHDALARAYPSERRMTIAPGLTICDGPSTPALIRALAAEVSRVLP